jgi:hypothetical protein
MTVALQAEGYEVNRKRVQRLMRIMGLEAMVPGPHTSRPHPEHPVYLYLLRGLSIVKPDQVWSADITYVPLAYGWAYLTVGSDAKMDRPKVVQPMGSTSQSMVTLSCTSPHRSIHLEDLNAIARARASIPMDS